MLAPPPPPPVHVAGSPSQEEVLYTEYEKAQKELKVFQKNSPPQLENKRRILLANLDSLQTDLYIVTNKSEFDKTNTLIITKVTEVLRAKTEEDLTTLEFSLGSIKQIINAYKELVKQRKKAGQYAIVASICGIVGLGILMIIATLGSAPSINTVLPIITIPLPILLWSTIGSFAAILYRFNKLGGNQIEDPIRWLWTRPITGIVMGMVAYLMASIGFLAISSKSTSTVSTNVTSPGTTELFWLIAFIGGFSDRFADGILKTLIGRFGGKDEKDFVTLDIIADTSEIADPNEKVTLPSSNNRGNDQVAKPGLNNARSQANRPRT